MAKEELERVMLDDLHSRVIPDRNTLQRWHIAWLTGERIASNDYRGGIRGSPDNRELEQSHIQVLGMPTLHPTSVASGLTELERMIKSTVTYLDREMSPAPTTPNHIKILVSAAAVLHCRFLKVSPFFRESDNLILARKLADYILLRYRQVACIEPYPQWTGRPHTHPSYEEATRSGLTGAYQAIITVFEALRAARICEIKGIPL
jgi:hypothetical protein